MKTFCVSLTDKNTNAFNLSNSETLTYHVVNFRNYVQGGHSSGKPGKVREMKSGQGEVRENELLQLFSCCDYCSDRNMQQWSSLLD